jgi:vacuolar-type H+-ATPase subunit D/Vma8
VAIENSKKKLDWIMKRSTATYQRVNSLGYSVIPRMLGMVRYIEMHLEEAERDYFFRLERMKSRMA